MSFYDVVKRHCGNGTELQCSEKAGISRNTLRMWRFVEPKATNIYKVAINLGIKPEDLFIEYIKTTLNGGQNG